MMCGILWANRMSKLSHGIHWILERLNQNDRYLGFVCSSSYVGYDIGNMPYYTS